VAPDFGFIRQIVRDAGCGLLVQPGDPVALSEAVEQLLRNPQASAVMGERGRRAVGEKYTWASEAPKLLALYEAIGRGCS
jgi:glycosyltransferase involved in cell wall biosynthesis